MVRAVQGGPRIRSHKYWNENIVYKLFVGEEELGHGEGGAGFSSHDF